MRKYDLYKDSGIEWIGEIPEHWKSTKLKFVGESIIGIIYSPDDVVNEGEGILVLRSSNIQDGKLAFEDCVYVDKEVQAKHRTKEGDILLCARNGSAHLVGKAAYIDKENEGVTFGAFMSIVRSELDKYLFYFFNSQIFKAQTGLFSTSTINQLTSDTLNNMFISYPRNKHEQTAIASYLDRKTAEIDELIADKKRLLELYEEEKTALINQAVTKGINPDVPMKDSGIEWLGDIPEHWEVKKVKHVLKSLNSVRVPLSADERGKMVIREYDYYGASGVIDRVEDYLFDEPLLLIGEDGANLVTRSTRLSFIARGKYWVNNHAHILKPTFGLLEYYCELMELCDYSIWISGSAQPKLTSENLMNIQIIVPPFDEQKSIMNYLETKCALIDAKKSKTEKLIELLTEYRTALISEVVTGKVKVIE